VSRKNPKTELLTGRVGTTSSGGVAVGRGFDYSKMGFQKDWEGNVDMCNFWWARDH
jgi:hypothetical protein